MQNEAFSTTSTTDTRIKRLGSYLVEAGLISQAHVNVALADQQATGMRFGEILVVRGWVKEQTIEYLMEKVILPAREVAANETWISPERQQEFFFERSPVEEQKVFDAFWENDRWVD